jgi:hypothetical protein
MNKAIEFAKRHTPSLVVIILVSVAAVFFEHYWSDPAKAQSAGGFLAFVAAAILIGVTWEYVRINQRALSLQQLQWEQQNKVILRFGIKRSEGKAKVWVANLGRTDCLITKMRIRVRGENPNVINQRRMARAGSRPVISLPDYLWTKSHLISAFDIQLSYESQHDCGTTVARAFTLVVAGSDVIKVIKGIDDSTSWLINCPKCKELAAMIVDGLTNFDEAADRQRVMESELSTTCPQHQSQWADSLEQLRSRRAERDRSLASED